MQIFIEENRAEMSRKAAIMLSEEILKKPRIVLCLPTGSTPIDCFKELIKIYSNQILDFSEATFFNMDEYIGLSKNNTNSNYYFLNKQLIENININKRNTFSPDALNKDREQACVDYANLIMEKGGIDLILLGIGRDGHIAFNMPAEELQLKIHIEQLSHETIADNARFFSKSEDVPTQAITLGIGDILSCKKIILIAEGPAKTEVIGKFLNNKSVTTKIPASFLWLHKDVTIILEKQAAANFKNNKKNL